MFVLITQHTAEHRLGSRIASFKETQISDLNMDKFTFPLQATAPLLLYVLAAFLVFLTSTSLFTIRRVHDAQSRKHMTEDGHSHDVSIHRTQIIRSNISHHRLFPRDHSFNYSYLSVGVPIRTPSSNWLLSVDESHWWSRGWLSVVARDHLGPEEDAGTLSEKLNTYLKKQGLDPEDFPHVYLLTSPRYLHCQFSPASFWYLYTVDLQLKFVIAEVNNTFNERRLYLFPARDCTNSSVEMMRKDFHVSPFSSRKGSYRLCVTDPAKEADISVTVTLYSSKRHPKLVARLWSIAKAIDPSSASPLQSLAVLSVWSWKLIMTWPRIVFQAIILAQVHRLDIWYRPEPMESAIARQATSSETFLATSLTRYLETLIKSTSNTVSLSLSGAGIRVRKSLSSQTVLTQESSSQPASSTCLNLRVHAPQFYRQMTTHETLSGTLAQSLLDVDVENRTAWSNDAKTLVATVQALETSATPPEFIRHNRDRHLLKAFWVIFRRLRRKQAFKTAYPYYGCPKARRAVFSGASEPPAHDTQKRTRFFLDDFIHDHCDSLTQLNYMYATLAIQFRARVMEVIGGE